MKNKLFGLVVITAAIMNTIIYNMYLSELGLLDKPATPYADDNSITCEAIYIVAA